jgi:nucleoside-diphosphate-sugar epimerase
VNTDATVTAVTGANGFLGEALVLRLLPGRRVRALFRQPCERSAAFERQGCEIVVGDLDSDQALAELVDRADVIHHCAATLAKSDLLLSHRVNVAGTERVARAALAAGARRFVYVSSTSVFAASRRDDNTFGEDTEPEDIDRLNNYSRTKYEGERVVQRIGREQGLRYTIVRPTNIYGLRSIPWFRRWVGFLGRVPVAFGDIAIDLVYATDVVDAMVAAANAPAAENGIFNIGHEMVKMSRLLAEIGRVMGRRVKVLPAGPDRGVRLAADWAFRTFTGSELSPSLVRPVYYPHDKAARVFGYAPRFPLADGMADLARRYSAGA